MRRPRALVVLIVAVTGLVSGGWLLQRSAQQGSRNVYQQARLFQDALAHIAQYYVDSIDGSQLYEMAIEGMLDRLNDPYTSYLKRQALDDLSLSTTGNYGGVGIQIDTRDGWITVVTPLADTPGERAGLLPGDQIVEVDGRSTAGWTTQQAANVMRGPPNTPVELIVVRAGVPNSLHFTITRARIHVNSIEGPMLLSPGIGYLRLNTVSASSARELAQAVDGLRRQGARALVLNLRNNSGGILDQGVALADLFVDGGRVVVETRGRAPGETQTYRAQHAERWPDMPVVVLVNRGTASAAEIFTGALQDHDRALVLGTPTFGKGVAYRLFPLSETEAISVTTSRWYTPSGRSINRPSGRNGRPPLMAQAGPDSTLTFRTSGGREIPGAGGIQPDIVLAPDTLTDREQLFADVLGAKVPQYRDAMARYALDLKAANTVLDRNFRVTGEMLTQLLRRLRERGVEMPDSVWAGATSFIARQLSYDVARYVFGRAEELRRQVADSKQIRHAVELLRQANTPADLIRLADTTRN